MIEMSVRSSVDHLRVDVRITISDGTEIAFEVPNVDGVEPNLNIGKNREDSVKL